MIDPAATGTVKRPSADLRRSAAAGKLFRPTLPPLLTTRPGGAPNPRRTYRPPRPSPLQPSAKPRRAPLLQALHARGASAESTRPSSVLAQPDLVHVTFEPARPDAVATGFPVYDTAPPPIPRRPAASRSKARGVNRVCQF